MDIYESNLITKPELLALFLIKEKIFNELSKRKDFPVSKNEVYDRAEFTAYWNKLVREGINNEVIKKKKKGGQSKIASPSIILELAKVEASKPETSKDSSPSIQPSIENTSEASNALTEKLLVKGHDVSAIYQFMIQKYNYVPYVTNLLHSFNILANNISLEQLELVINDYITALKKEHYE